MRQKLLGQRILLTGGAADAPCAAPDTPVAAIANPSKAVTIHAVTNTALFDCSQWYLADFATPDDHDPHPNLDQRGAEPAGLEERRPFPKPAQIPETRHSPEGMNFKHRAEAVGWREAVRERDLSTFDWTANRPIPEAG